MTWIDSNGEEGVEQEEQHEFGKVFQQGCCRNSLSVAATMVAHFVCVLFTGFVVYTAKPGSSLFSWHPTLMSIAFALLMMEGILVFSPQSSLVSKFSRRAKSNIHWIMMVAALTCLIPGQLAIGINKNINNKPHLTTWHGRLGIVTFFYCLLQSFGGAFQMWNFLYKLIPKSFGLTRGKLKGYHATSGLTLYLLASVTIFLGMNSNWFTSQVTGTSWYMCLVCPMILLFVVMNQVTAAYLPKTKP